MVHIGGAGHGSVSMLGPLRCGQERRPSNVLPRRCPPARPPALAENTWQLLESAIREINNHNASGLSFEELYRCGGGRSWLVAWQRPVGGCWPKSLQSACRRLPTAPRCLSQPTPTPTMQERVQHGGQQVRRAAVQGAGRHRDCAPAQGGAWCVGVLPARLFLLRVGLLDGGCLSGDAGGGVRHREAAAGAAPPSLAALAAPPSPRWQRASRRSWARSS